MPDFYGMIAYQEGPGRTVVLSAEHQMTADYVKMLVSAISWSLAYFLGGLVAGRMAGSSAGLNGALTAVLGVLVGVAWFSWDVLPLVMGAFADPVSRAEDLALISFWVMEFSVALPLALLVSYLGGRVGGRLRGRSAIRHAA